MSRHVVIVGAGVIGLCTALSCARRGWRVTVVERGSASRGGCSFGNAGMVVPSHFTPLAAPGMVAQGLRWMANPESPFYIKPRLDRELLSWGLRFWRAATRERVERAAPILRDLGMLSRNLHVTLARELEVPLKEEGLLMLCQTRKALDEEAHAAEKARALGLEARVLDAAATAQLDRGVTMDVAGSIYFPSDCHLSPASLMAALEKEARRLGVEFVWETECAGFSHEGVRLLAVQTGRGEIEGDEFVLCGGVWTQEMARDLKLRLPMQAGKGYSLTLGQPRQLPRKCSICVEARVAVTPMDGALRFGGTMEMAGLETPTDPRRVRGIIRAATRYFPAFRDRDFEGLEAWSGLRPCSPDGLPYLGRTARWANALLATGHAMMGLSLAPVTGQIVAGLLEGEAAPVPLELLSPDRFHPLA